VFNLADSAIVCGGILTVLLALLGLHMDATRGDRSAAAAPEPAAPEPAAAATAPESGGSSAQDAVPGSDASSSSAQPGTSAPSSRPDKSDMSDVDR
jgi:signal peptidase II